MPTDARVMHLCLGVDPARDSGLVQPEGEAAATTKSGVILPPVAEAVAVFWFPFSAHTQTITKTRDPSATALPPTLSTSRVTAGYA